jgi:hypothetical protein
MTYTHEDKDRIQKLCLGMLPVCPFIKQATKGFSVYRCSTEALPSCVACDGTTSELHLYELAEYKFGF